MRIVPKLRVTLAILYSFQKALGSGFLRLSLKVENIFNQTYYNHLSRIKEVLPEPGRRFIGKLQYNF